MNRFSDIDYSFKKLPPIYGFYSQKLVSIEKALEPIETKIKELSYYITIAKKHCYYPNKHELSKDQSASIYIYTMEWGSTSLYRVLNQALRSEDRDELKIWFPYLKLFDTALDLLPTYTGAIWRGVSLDIGKNFIRDQIFTWWSVNSCSSSPNVIKKFLDKNKQSTLFLVEVINGKRISGYTNYEKEDEVILKMGTDFRVQGDVCEYSENLVLVHLIETNGYNDQTLITTKKALKSNLKWKKQAKIIAGGNGAGKQLNQFNGPQGIYVDDEQKTIYVADRWNHRILKWKLGENSGQIVAGGNGQGQRIDQLSLPTDVIVDQNTKDLIICDFGNSRIVRWSMNNQSDRQIIISDIRCCGLMMNDNGDLFVSDYERNTVTRWKKNGTEGTIIVGDNGWGNRLDQLNQPRCIFIDHNDTVYISDWGNHRITKWIKGAKEGIIVADRQGEGIIVNQIGDIYTVDSFNHRVICWPLESTKGHVVIGGNGAGHESNQLNGPTGLSFDIDNNLYVVDTVNNRIQRFDVDKN